MLPLKSESAKRNAYGFYAIDWAGATTSGRPFFDLLAFGMSCGLTPAALMSQAVARCQSIKCERRDVLPYFLAALGAIGMDLEHFPESRYVAMCRDRYDRVAALMARPGPGPG